MPLQNQFPWFAKSLLNPLALLALHINILAFMEHYHNRVFSVKETLVTPKRFHDWLREGLLPLEVPEGKKNLMSLPEFIWVKLIDRLRQVGTPLEHIRELKAFLFMPINPQHLKEGLRQQQTIRTQLLRQMESVGLREEAEDLLDSEKFFTVLEDIGQTILDSILLRLLLTPDEIGVMLLPSGYFKVWVESLGEPRMNQTHVYLSISEELSLFRSQSLQGPKAVELNQVTDEEWQVIWAIRNRKAKEVKVTFLEKGEQRRMDITTTSQEEVDPALLEKIIELVKLGKYTDVTLKMQGSQDIYVERKKRKRV